MISASGTAEANATFKVVRLEKQLVGIVKANDGGAAMDLKLWLVGNSYSEREGYVMIQFSALSNVTIGEQPTELLKAAKCQIFDNEAQCTLQLQSKQSVLTGFCITCALARNNA